MSNPNEVPQQPGFQPPQSGNTPSGEVPPAGYQPPQGTPQPPPGYQAPPPGYQQPGYQAPPPSYGTPGQQNPGSPGEGFHFEMPTDGPKSFNDVMPKGGFSGMFNVAGMPTELKVSYWIWLIGGFLGILGGLIGFFGTLVLFSVVPGFAAVLLILVLVSLVLAAAQVILAMKMKEGKEWARLALSALVVVGLLISIIASASLDGQGNNWFGFIIGAAAAVLMWLPNSQAWFKSVKGNV